MPDFDILVERFKSQGIGKNDAEEKAKFILGDIKSEGTLLSEEKPKKKSKKKPTKNDD